MTASTILTGPPRCGTYWISRFLKYGCGVVAGHEQVNFLQDPNATPVEGIDCNNTFALAGAIQDVKVVGVWRGDWRVATTLWLESTGRGADALVLDTWDSRLLEFRQNTACLDVDVLFTPAGVARLLNLLRVDHPGPQVVQTWLDRRLSKPYDLWMKPH